MTHLGYHQTYFAYILALGVVEQRGQYALAERGYPARRNTALLRQLR